MGNEVERQQYIQHQLGQKKKHGIFNTNSMKQKSERPSIQGHCDLELTAEEKEVGRVGRDIRSSGRTENSSSKHKKYLSLTKEVGADSKLQVSRSSSKEKKGIKLTPTQNHMKYSIAQFINYNDTSSNNRESTVIKKTAIRPRDLPRHSSQKIIPSVPFTIKTGFIPNQSAKFIPNQFSQVQNISRITYPSPSQPQISINYAFPVNSRPQAQSSYVGSLQSSNVTPFRPVQTAENWMKKSVPEDFCSKKLKRVPLTRSFQLNPNTTISKSIHTDNQEESMFVKEVSDMTKLKNDLVQIEKSKFLREQSKKVDLGNKENKQIQKESQSISSKKIERDFKQSESKYAVAYEHKGVYIQHMLKDKPLSESITKESARSMANKYSVAVDRWMASNGTCDQLQEKVEREVLSHPVIEEPFVFPTATDISYEDRSDNTSFLPIQKHHHNDSISYIQLQGEDLLQYCKPNINSKVLADMLRLPLKS